MFSLKQWIIKVTEAIQGLQKSEQANVSLPSSYTNHGEARNFYQRKGNTCTIGFDFTPPSSQEAVTLFTLPASCRPLRDMRFSATPLSWGSVSGQQYIVVYASTGAVSYTGNTRVFGTYVFNCVGEYVL